MRRRRQSGSTMIEFAVGSTVLVTMFAGVFQFGWSLLIYNNLMTSVTNAAIIASQRNYDQSAPSDFTNDIKNMVVYGDVNGGTTLVAPNLATSQVAVTLTSNAGVPQFVTVSIDGYQVRTLFANYTLTNKPRVTVPFAGTISCSSC